MRAKCNPRNIMYIHTLAYPLTHTLLHTHHPFTYHVLFKRVLQYLSSQEYNICTLSSHYFLIISSCHNQRFPTTKPTRELKSSWWIWRCPWSYLKWSSDEEVRVHNKHLDIFIHINISTPSIHTYLKWSFGEEVRVHTASPSHNAYYVPSQYNTHSFEVIFRRGGTYTINTQ